MIPLYKIVITVIREFLPALPRPCQTHYYEIVNMQPGEVLDCGTCGARVEKES